MLNDLLDFFQITDKYLTYLSDKIEFSNDGFPIFTREMSSEEEPEMIIPYYNRHNKLVKDPSKTVDISKVKDEEFAEIPYKTLLKILNRLEEEKIVTSVSKGVYSIGKPTSGSQPNVLKQYIGNGKGMIVGYMLYNSMVATDKSAATTKILFLFSLRFLSLRKIWDRATVSR